MFLKLFSVLYINGHLSAATMLPPHTSLVDCERINSRYEERLPSYKQKNVRMACEFHFKSPTKNMVKF